MILTVKSKDTTLTSKGTTSIPAAIRQAAGLFPGSRIAWDFEGGEIRARRREGGTNKAQTHIRKYAGTWQGHCSGAELLRRTRP
jgi:bifunctional DNA-binding transcriptional regulator/antitoxin component of YhaV-PrlF toxin-antitoxin module